ncbi:MAG: hypothetical protein KME11_13810 [Timaviella obliquedivisa GSE-PSE-MK23-08B]|nr:hypothetical protein [Timaviella obliquedivisa GSE-PSE-MK23-08B]
MKSLNPLDTLSCEAFIRAIPQINEPLPDALQNDIRSTLQAIANQRPQSTFGQRSTSTPTFKPSTKPHTASCKRNTKGTNEPKAALPYPLNPL